MEKSSELFDRWFWLWQLGLAEDPEISVLISEMPDDCTEYYRLIDEYLQENEDLRIVRGEPTIVGPWDSNFWLGPADSIEVMKAYIYLILEILPDDRKGEPHSRHWVVSSGRLQCEDWKRLYLKQKGLGKLDSNLNK